MSTMIEDAECRTQSITVPDGDGNPAHVAWRIEAISLGLLERRRDAVMEANGVVVAEFRNPVQDRKTGLWIAYGYTMTEFPTE